MAPPVPVATSENGLMIDCENGASCSLFQALYLLNALELNKFYDENCPSLLLKDAKDKTIMECSACPKCNLYHSTIPAMKKTQGRMQK